MTFNDAIITIKNNLLYPGDQLKPSYLYRITNNVNGKMYYGVSVNPNKRFMEHCRADSVIGRAINKHGVDNFSLDLLVCGERSYIFDLEKQIIVNDQSSVPNGYNIHPGGSGGRQKGFKHSPETIEKVRNAKKGIKFGPCPEERKQKISLANKGKKRTPEHNERNRAAQLGKKHTPEQVEKNRVSHIGKKHTPEAIEKMRVAAAARVVSKETKIKISTTMLGRSVPDETKAKISAARKGIKRPPEVVEKIRNTKMLNKAAKLAALEAMLAGDTHVNQR